MRAPEDVRKYLDEDLFKLYQLICSVCGVADAAGDFRSDDDRHSAATTLSALLARCKKFDGYLRVYQMPASLADRDDDEKDDEAKGRALPQVAEGQNSALDKIRPDNTSPSRRRGSTMPRWSGVGRRRHRRPRRMRRSFPLSSSAIRHQDAGTFPPTMLATRQHATGKRVRRHLRRHVYGAASREELDEIGKASCRARSRQEFWENSSLT